MTRLIDKAKALKLKEGDIIIGEHDEAIKKINEDKNEN